MSGKAVRYDTRVSSHRGKKGLSSKTNSDRNPSLVHLYQEMDKESLEKKKRDKIVNTSNISKAKTTQSSSRHKKRQSNHRSFRKRNQNREINSDVNLLPELDAVRNIGVADECVTPQELYAIGAVFDHLYRGGSPLNCISVFQKEINRRPPNKTIGCGGFGCDVPEEDETFVTKVQSEDDDTLPTTDWTFTRFSMDEDADTLMDLYTLDEDATFDRSFRSGDSVSQYSLDGERSSAGRFANERHNKKEDKGPPRGKSFLDDEVARFEYEYADRQKRLYGQPVDSEDSEDAIGRLQTWSEILVASAEESASAAVAAAANADTAGAGVTSTPAAFRKSSSMGSSHSHTSISSDIPSLVRMMRNAVAEGIPEQTIASTASLQAALVRTFSTNLGSFLQSYGSHDSDDQFDASDSSYETIFMQQKPLNSLARAMKTIATKEPTRTFAVSEQEQVAGRQKTSNAPAVKITISPPTLPADLSTTFGSSVEMTIESAVTPPHEPRETSSLSPIRIPDSNALSRRHSSIISALSAANASRISEGLGSHRGDTSSDVTPAMTNKIPTSIQFPPSTSESTIKSIALQELFLSPKSVTTSSPSVANPNHLSLHRNRTWNTTFDEHPSHLNSSRSSPSPRRHLPPFPPSRSPTTPSKTSPTRNRNLIDDNTEANGTDNATIVTPPRSTAGTLSSSSTKFLTGINIKKRFSFRKQKTENSIKDLIPTSESSPRSIRGVDSSTIFQIDTGNSSTEMYQDTSVITADENSIIVTPASHTNFEISTNDGVSVSDHDMFVYEESSV